MQELQNAVSTAFANIVASGAIEKAIQEQLGKTVDSLIKEQLREYGDFGKALKEHVAKAMQVNFADLDLPSYNHFILSVIRKQADAALAGDIAKKLEADMAKLLQDAPAEITLEQLIEDFRDEFKEKYGEPRYGNFTLYVRESEGVSGYWHIAMDPDERASEYSCKFRLAVAGDGRVYSMQIGDMDVKKSLFTLHLSGFERQLFRMYAAGTKVIIPPHSSEDDFSTSFGND